MTMRVATKAVGETDRTKSRPPKTATSVWMLQAARSERQGFTNSRIGPDIQGCRARCRSPGEARVTGHKVGNDSIGTRPCSLHGCPSELLLLRVPVQIFLWDIVLRHLVRANFSRGIPSSVLDALTASASNAFPSSSNSSILSESAPATPDNPCKSPDCSPERRFIRSLGNAGAVASFFFRVLFLGARVAFFGATAFFRVFALPLDSFFLAVFFAGVIFLRAVDFDFVCFFLGISFCQPLRDFDYSAL